MDNQKIKHTSEEVDIETREWLDSLDYVLETGGPDRVIHLLEHLQIHAQSAGVKLPFTANTPYINTIPAHEQVSYPGNRDIERRVKSLVRWNAMAMVVRANREENGIGGHISTYASVATLYEIGFNHFFKGQENGNQGDQVYFQGHSAPGVYARAFLEGRLTREQLGNFRRELRPGGGLSSYPHPWLMPGFWQFPTVSMGLAPVMAIYQARYNRYLEDRGLKKDTGNKVWAFLGDGEMDEPEALGAITLASRENLDNLIFVINCNLQRLDGPVRGNGKIIQELEAAFRGAGWNAIKVIWGSDWDHLLAKDNDGILGERMGQVVDGEYQKYVVESGSYIREHFFGTDHRLLEMAKPLSDEQISKMRRGGHDPEKVYAAFKKATEHKGAPTVILAKTIKGYGLGEAGEGKNITHSQKKLNEEEMRQFRTRFSIPISDEDIAETPFYKPDEDSAEIKYIKERRAALGGSVPSRREKSAPIPNLPYKVFEEFYLGSDGRDMSTTMAFIRILTKLLKTNEVGKLLVPIVPDEARTFGMESLFRQCGIYSHVGQLYEPVDSDSILYYKEAQDGQILEEGITETGAMSSFIAAGTAYSTHGINTIPFFIFYSMFGLQRIGDLIWAAGDMRCRGFLIGGTAGRTSLAGEGLQHQDGNSHLLAYPQPTLAAYDPAFAYELAVIIKDGIRRMYIEQENVLYYITVENEPYAMLPMPKGAEEGILKGMYMLKPSKGKKNKAHTIFLASGAIVNEALKAQEILESKYKLTADVWSVTSYKALSRNAHDTERYNLRNPDKKPKTPYITKCLSETPGVVVAASDYVKALTDTAARWIEQPVVNLGTDGFGRSENRSALRDFFEVDAKHLAFAALSTLEKTGKLKTGTAARSVKELNINQKKENPVGL